MGWLARRHRFISGPVITLAGLLYTIPSLALFVVLPGLLHTKILDPINVIVALTIYTVALLVRVVADGLASVPDDVQQAATAMGYRSLGRLVAVELPIAVPVIAAGLRVAAVSNVSLVAVAAILGVPELGQLFTNGFQLFRLDPIILGILGCLLLALVFDALIVGLGRWLTPWRRAVGAS
jgi:osmoprotectant transport system permease protein